MLTPLPIQRLPSDPPTTIPLETMSGTANSVIAPETLILSTPLPASNVK